MLLQRPDYSTVEIAAGVMQWCWFDREECGCQDPT